MAELQIILEDPTEVVWNVKYMAELVKKHSGRDSLRGIAQEYEQVAEEIRKFNIAVQMYQDDLEFARACLMEDRDDPAYKEGLAWGDRLIDWRKEIESKFISASSRVAGEIDRNGFSTFYEKQLGRLIDADIQFCKALAREVYGNRETGMKRVEEVGMQRALRNIQNWMEKNPPNK